MSSFSIVLQAGGKSSRMGVDKALVPFMGTTLLRYILDQIRPLTDDLVLIANRPGEYEAFGLPIYPDVYQDWGALGGLHAAIYHAPSDPCLVLACDMPFLSTAFLLELVSLAAEYDAVIPRLAKTGFTEPFRAAYRKTCLGPIEQAIKNRQRRVNSFFDHVRVRYMDQAEIEHYDPALRTFFNVNTPADLETAQQIAAGMD